VHSRTSGYYNNDILFGIVRRANGALNACPREGAAYDVVGHMIGTGPMTVSLVAR
jgi:hypothetical protein